MPALPASAGRSRIKGNAERSRHGFGAAEAGLRSAMGVARIELATVPRMKLEQHVTNRD
jgi:hypothetical protein